MSAGVLDCADLGNRSLYGERVIRKETSDRSKGRRKSQNAFRRAVGNGCVAMLLELRGTLWSYTLSSKVADQQPALADAAAQDTKLAAAMQVADVRLRSQSENGAAECLFIVFW